MFYEIGFPKNVAKFTGKHLEWSHLLINLQVFAGNLRANVFFFFYLGFLSWTFTNHRTAGEGGGHFFNSSLPLPPASQTLRHPGDFCREQDSFYYIKPRTITNVGFCLLITTSSPQNLNNTNIDLSDSGTV